MTTFQKLRQNAWAVPAVSGTLIVVAWISGFSPLMIAAAVVAGVPIVIKAVRALLAKVVSIDLLVSIAAIGAVIIGEYWEAAAVTFLFALGHALEARTMNKTRSALAELVAVAPDRAIILEDGKQVEVAAASVPMGATVLVKTGAKVPVDGVVLEGIANIDEASITGESLPVEKVAGDKVFAGSISRGGLIQVETTGVGANTTLARIIHRVEDAQDAKAKTQSFMERFSAWYTPGIIVLALGAGLITRSVELGLTLLVIGCPGALVISIPVAVVAGIGRGARDGILIKGGEYLETSAKIDAVALDKTGTLTRGTPELTDVIPFQDWSGDEEQLLWWAARAEAGSEHPLSRPIIEAAKARGLDISGLPEDTHVIAGKGVVATVEGVRVAVGNLALVEAEVIPAPEADPEAATTDYLTTQINALSDQGRTAMTVVIDGHVAGVVAVADQIRPDAKRMVKRLRRIGIKQIAMLTGDNERVARAVGTAVGIKDIHAALLPEEKLDVIKSLQDKGATVAMVGDGVNDAPALAAANVGIAMGAAGTAVAIETADIALMNDDLLKLPQGISLAKRTIAVMRQNIAIALLTVFLLLLGVFLDYVDMALGMLIHEGSVLLVIANAMRLMR